MPLIMDAILLTERNYFELVVNAASMESSHMTSQYFSIQTLQCLPLFGSYLNGEVS